MGTANLLLCTLGVRGSVTCSGAVYGFPQNLEQN